MKSSLEEVHGSRHLKAEEMVGYESGTLAEGDPRHAEVERHLAACQRCAADLVSLRAASWAAPSIPEDKVAPVARAGRRWWAAAATLVAAAVAVPALWILLQPQADQITFLPARRGPVQAPVLEGGGPWTVTVILPLQAPPGRYSVHLESDGSGTVQLEEAAAERDSRSLRIVVPQLRGPGSYRMVVRARQLPETPPYSYTFDVAPPRRRDPEDERK